MPQRLKDSKIHSSVNASIEKIGKLIVDSSFFVHKQLGAELLEKVNEICLCHELTKKGLKYERQKKIPIVYDNIKFEEGLRIDAMVEDCFICELKATETVNPVWEAQIISHLKLTDKKLGYLINFKVPQIKYEIRRFIN